MKIWSITSSTKFKFRKIHLSIIKCVKTECYKSATYVMAGCTLLAGRIASKEFHDIFSRQHSKIKLSHSLIGSFCSLIEFLSIQSAKICCSPSHFSHFQVAGYCHSPQQTKLARQCCQFYLITDQKFFFNQLNG